MLSCLCTQAYLTAELEVLEEHYHEYVKVSHFRVSSIFLSLRKKEETFVLFQLEDNSLEKKWHMVQQEGQLVINKVTAVGEVTQSSDIILKQFTT